MAALAWTSISYAGACNGHESTHLVEYGFPVHSRLSGSLQFPQLHIQSGWKPQHPPSHSCSLRACLGKTKSFSTNSSAEFDSDKTHEKLLQAFSINASDIHPQPLCGQQHFTLLTEGNLSQYLVWKSSEKLFILASFCNCFLWARQA